MRKILLASAIMALVLAGVATAEPNTPSLARQVGALRVSTWQCQDQLGLERTKAAESAWSLPRSALYRKWAISLWKKRERACEQALSKRTIPATSDWTTAVRLVQRIYPGTEDWLLYISRREGGHGSFVMNNQGSGAGGWMQFMSSTFYAYNERAFADARRRGFILPESTNRWTHPLGQAVTAGYMRYTGLDGCHWCL